MRGMDAFFSNLDKAKKEILDECEMVAHKTAASMERYAKENKRWEHRTGHAEDSLKGKAHRTKKKISAEIWQDMYGISGKEYGYWLENAKRFHGRYAILKPTRDAHAGMFFDGIQEAIGYAINRV